MKNHVFHIIKHVQIYGTKFCKIELHTLSSTAIDIFRSNKFNQGALGYKILKQSDGRRLTV